MCVTLPFAAPATSLLSRTVRMVSGACRRRPALIPMAWPRFVTALNMSCVTTPVISSPAIIPLGEGIPRPPPPPLDAAV